MSTTLRVMTMLQDDSIRALDRSELVDGMLTLRAALADAEKERDDVRDAMSSCGGRFLDPPDGGDVPLAEQVRRCVAALADAEARLQRTCIWTQADLPASDEYYETSCGRAFSFIDGDARENECDFCQYCGGRVREVREFEVEEGDNAGGADV